MPNPYKRHIIIKHWGFQHEGPFGINIYVPVNWMDLEPKWLLKSKEYVFTTL